MSTEGTVAGKGDKRPGPAHRQVSNPIPDPPYDAARQQGRSALLRDPAVVALREPIGTRDALQSGPPCAVSVGTRTLPADCRRSMTGDGGADVHVTKVKART